jgi:TorA maturation chaperone TorD
MSEQAETIDAADILIDMLAGRREFYLALAGFYSKPLTQAQIDEMAKTDYSVFGAGEPLLEAGFNDITRYLRKRNTGTRQMLATDFTSSFGGAGMYKGKTAVPYASVFSSATGLLSQGSRSEVFRVFKRNLLRVVSENTPDDHLSFMLEFLAVMSDRAAEAVREGRTGDACACLAESRDFINNHILNWFDAFAEQTNLLIEARFYRGVLKITKGYLLLDLHTLDDLLAELGEK